MILAFSPLSLAGCCLSLTPSGLACRLGCFPTVARSAAAMAALCFGFCFRRAGGRLLFTFVSAAVAFTIPWHSSLGCSYSSSVANLHPLSALF